jgi:hypothetical protein
MAETTPSSSYQSNPFRPLLATLSHTIQHNGIPAMQIMLLAFAGVVVIYLAAALVFIILGGLLGPVAALVIPLALAALLYWLGRIVSAQVKLIQAAAHSTPGPWRRYVNEAAPLAWRMAGLLLLSWLIIGLGMVLLIVPGFYLLGRLGLSAVALASEDLSVSAAMKRSWHLTRGHAIETLGAIFASVVVASGGLVGSLVPLNALYGRYTQLQELGSAPAPKVHWLNYLLTFLIPALIVLAILVNIFAMKHAPKPHQNDVNDLYNSYDLNGQ